MAKKETAVEWLAIVCIINEKNQKHEFKRQIR